jgi:hypothetical protein
MYAVSTTHARSTTAKGIRRYTALAAAYMNWPPIPAPRWCRICDMLVEGLEFEAHHRAHLAQAAPCLLPVPSTTAREKQRFACLKCGKDFAHYSRWETHEAGCIAKEAPAMKFKKIKPLICEISPDPLWQARKAD